MKQERCIALKGEKFTIEWYFDEKDKSPALEYFKKLSIEGKKKLTKLFSVMVSQGAIFKTTDFNNEGDKIYAFKPKPDRFLCFFFVGSKIIVTNAFEKKQDKLPLREKEKALKLKENYITRVRGGTYYD